MITKEEYEALKQQHEDGCKTNDYSKMVMLGDENHKKKNETIRKTVLQTFTNNITSRRSNR